MNRSSLDDAAKSYALEYLGESEDVAKDSVLEIRHFLSAHPSVKAHEDEHTILCFLRSCKFNVEQTEKKILR